MELLVFASGVKTRGFSSALIFARELERTCLLPGMIASKSRLLPMLVLDFS